jgi:hypothetical protein
VVQDKEGEDHEQGHSRLGRPPRRVDGSALDLGEPAPVEGEVVADVGSGRLRQGDVWPDVLAHLEWKEKNRALATRSDRS